MIYFVIGLFFALLILKVPVVFSMSIPAIIYFIAEGIPLSIVAQRMTGAVDSFSLLTIPLFAFAGAIMNTGGITNRLFKFAHKMTGHWRGGLGYTNVIVSIIFAGMSGPLVRMPED